MNLSKAIASLLLLVASSNAFTTQNKPSFSRSSVTCNVKGDALDLLNQDLQMRWKIFQDSNEKGYNFKQSMANVLAGEYDQEKARKEVEELSVSAPCVIFAWQASPSCKKAFEQLDKAGVQYKVVRLDDPWDEGNALRAELGKMVGRSSVPAIFIGGKYVGGFDGGVSDEAPGILDMAFKGTLRPMLEVAGALPATEITMTSPEITTVAAVEEASVSVEATKEAKESAETYKYSPMSR